MSASLSIRKVQTGDIREVCVMVGELLSEIVKATGVLSFDFNLNEAIGNLNDFLEHDKYFVFVAERNGKLVGFINLIESYALYAEGTFGTIPELYVRPQFRSNKVGLHLLDEAKAFGRLRGWKRLEVTTPALPRFERTLEFYEREEFIISGGRKLRVLL